MSYEKIVVSAPTHIKFSSTSGSATGGPTLFTAINKRIVVTLSASKKGEVSSHTFTRQINSIITFLNPQLPTDVVFSLAISGSNRDELGSYTALVVATIGAVIYFTKHLWNPHEINKLAFEYLKSERPTSGGEVTAVTFGGFIWERRELSFLNSIWQLPIKLLPKLDHFYLLQMRSSTMKPVQLSQMLVKQLAEALKKGDDSWLRQNLQATSVGDKLYVCYDLDTSKHSDGTFEKIHLGGEGIRLENKE